jgi:hypothetical protein
MRRNPGVPRIILTDIDDSVLSYAETLQTYLEARGVRFRGELRDVHHFDAVTDLSEEEGAALITQFALDDRHFANLPPEPCAAEVIPLLYSTGWQFVGISACGTDPRVHEMRMQNLERVFGFPWTALHTVGYQDAKDVHLRRYNPTYWVEDNRRHAVMGGALGHRAFLLDRPHNGCGDRPDPRIIRVKSWWDILRQIDEDEVTPPQLWSWPGGVD